MSCKCCGTMKWIGGLFTGAAIGAAAALLFAPKSGKATREKISENIRDTYYDAYDAVLNFGDKVSDQIADLRADFKEWAAKAKKEEAAAFEDEFDEYEDDEVLDAEEMTSPVKDENEAAEEEQLQENKEESSEA